MKNFPILIVDDSISFSLYLQDILSTNGYNNVFLSHNFESAKEILLNENIQLVILDIELNTENKEEGFLLGKFIKNNYDIPIIFITAKQEEEIKHLLETNINNFDLYALLYKPFQFTELEILIKTLIKNYQEKKIQEHSYQKLVEYINYPTIILNKKKILYQNQNFTKFINSFKENDIFRVIPELENIIEEIYKKPLKELKYKEFKINTYNDQQLKIEIIPLTNEFLQIIFYYENENNSIKEKIHPLSSLLNLFDKILEGILIIDSKRNIIYANQTFLKMFQYEEKEILNKNVKVLKNSRYPLRYYVNIWKELKEKKYWEGKFYATKKNKEEFTGWLFISQIESEITKEKYYISIIVDFSSRIDFEEYLFFLAHYDELTSLPNRRYFNEVLKKEIFNSLRNHSNFALIFIDLDNFKFINDNYGHLAGDYVLKVVGNFLKKTLRKSDFIARIGGDEFCSIITKLKSKFTIIPILEKILNLLNQKITYKNFEIPLSLSLGVAFFPDDIIKLDPEILKNKSEAELREVLIHIADKKMYKAKKEGGNKYSFEDAELEQYSNFRNLVLKNQNLEFKIEYHLIQKKDNKIMAIELIPIVYSENPVEFANVNHFHKLFLESHPEKQEKFFSKLITLFQNQNYDIFYPLYLRFSLRTLIEKNYFQKIIELAKNKKIILELTEFEMIHLMEYHQNILHYLKNYNIFYSIRKYQLEEILSFSKIQDFNIFCILPHFEKPYENFTIEEEIKLKIFINHSKVFHIPILLENINSENDYKKIQTFDFDFYYKGKINSYSTFEDLKMILHQSF